MTKNEVAQYLGVSPKTVEKYVRDGVLTKYALPKVRTVRFRRDEVEALFEPA